MRILEDKTPQKTKRISDIKRNKEVPKVGPKTVLAISVKHNKVFYAAGTSVKDLPEDVAKEFKSKGYLQ